MTGWRAWWRRYLGWFPVQWCMTCGRAFWGGYPFLEEYCSHRCVQDPVRGWEARHNYPVFIPNSPEGLDQEVPADDTDGHR